MGTTVLTSDRRDPTNPFAPTEYPGWMDNTPDNRRAALVERVARVLADGQGEHQEGVWSLYAKDATAAIDLIRNEVLEEAVRVVEGEITGPWSDEDRAKNAARRYDAAAIRALKGK